MTRTNVWLAMVGCCVWMACNGDDDGAARPERDNPPEASPPAIDEMSETSATPTYWGDMAPLFAEHCMRCHREGGIAPFRLDDYAQAKSFATLIAHVTRERTMPPWAVTSDGSCGEFANSEALNDDEIERISRWVDSGAAEGTRRAIDVPAVPSLANAREFKTPNFLPQIAGGELASADEYRCFALDAPSDQTAFITGYEVVPGNSEIVHHVVVMFVDPSAPAELEDSPGLTNGEQMRMLDDESPDRDGWPCFGMAGDGLSVAATPVVWAPGQGVVDYPNDSGVPLLPQYKIIVQVHYNLADEGNRGKSVQTTLRLRSVPRVKNVGLFALQDQLLDTLFDDNPVTLPAGKASTLFTWTANGKQIGLDSLPEALLYGIMPHMHELGRKYTMTVTQDGASEQCAANVDKWDFHWQRMYFYAEPLTIKADTRISVTCDYDTTSVNVPVKPGWGTHNEMCLATMYFTVPASVFDGM
jgi:hypothetical protein